MAIIANTISDVGASSIQDVVKILRTTIQDLEDQLNERAQIYSSVTGKIPSGLNSGDVLFTSSNGEIGIRIKNAKSYDTLTANMLGGLSANGTNFLGVTIATGAPTLASFPVHLNWGFYYKTSVTAAFYLCINYNNSLLKVALT